MVVIAMLNKSAPPPAKRDAVPSGAMVLIEIAPAPVAPAPMNVIPDDSLARRKHSTAASADSSSSPQRKTTASILVKPQGPEMRAEVAPPADKAEAAIDVLPPLRLDPETIRKAIQQDGRESKPIGFATRNASAPARSGSDTAFAAAISAAGRKGCERGEYVGAGMGLLSAPFLAAAALRGDCAQ